MRPTRVGDDHHPPRENVVQRRVAHDDNRVVEPRSDRRVQRPRYERAAAEGGEELGAGREPAPPTGGEDDGGGRQTGVNSRCSFVSPRSTQVGS